MKRLELLAGSILVGNNGVKNEFSQIKLAVINHNQFLDLLIKYVI